MAETETVDSSDAEVSFAGSFEGAEWEDEEEKEDNVRHRGAEAYLFEPEYTEEEMRERAARGGEDSVSDEDLDDRLNNSDW